MNPDRKPGVGLRLGSEALLAGGTADEWRPVWQCRSRAPVKLLVGRQVAHVFQALRQRVPRIERDDLDESELRSFSSQHHQVRSGGLLGGQTNREGCRDDDMSKFNILTHFATSLTCNCGHRSGNLLDRDKEVHA